MNLTDAFNYINGYVIVRIRGRQPERFLNLALRRNIYIWNIKRRNDEIIFCISVKGFFLLRPIARKTGVRIKIIGKKGLFRLAKRARKRKIFFIAAAVFLSVVVFFGSLVLKIDISGNESIETSKIIEKLNSLGLKKFALRSNIDTERISDGLMKEFGLISWVGIYENGTHITVEIKEKRKAPRIVPMDKPQSLVAARDGIIINVNAENGEKCVAPGETVVKGQLLVSGEVPIGDSGEVRYVHSMGNAIAQTWYEKEVDCKLYEYEKIYTGKTKKAVITKVFSHEWGGGIVPFFNYDTEIKRHILGFIEADTYIYKEYILKKKAVSESRAVDSAKEDLKNEFETAVGKEAVKEIEYEVKYKDEETRRIKAVARCVEDIAEEKEIKEIWQKEQSEALPPPQ